MHASVKSLRRWKFLIIFTLILSCIWAEIGSGWMRWRRERERERMVINTIRWFALWWKERAERCHWIFFFLCSRNEVRVFLYVCVLLRPWTLRCGARHQMEKDELLLWAKTMLKIYRIQIGILSEQIISLPPRRCFPDNSIEPTTFLSLWHFSLNFVGFHWQKWDIYFLNNKIKIDYSLKLT